MKSCSPTESGSVRPFFRVFFLGEGGEGDLFLLVFFSIVFSHLFFSVLDFFTDGVEWVGPTF